MSISAEFSESSCRRALDRYPMIGRVLRVLQVTRESGFSGAHVSRIQAESGEFALRATASDDVVRSRLAGLHRLLAHLQRGGTAAAAIPTPVPLTDCDGMSFFSAAGYVWQLEPWMPGRADYWQRPGPERLAAAVRTLAQWHRAAESFCAAPDERPWFFIGSGSSPGLIERRQRIARNDAPRLASLRDELQSLRGWDAFRSLGLRLVELYERAAPRIALELDAACTVAAPLQPCLRDIWHDHVLFSGDEVTGLIDPFACRSDNVGTDLARLLGSLAGDDRLACSRALAEYQQIRPLSTTESGLIPVFDRSGVLLSGLTWLEWVCLEKRRFQQPERVTERLRHCLDRLERLV